MKNYSLIIFTIFLSLGIWSCSEEEQKNDLEHNQMVTKEDLFLQKSIVYRGDTLNVGYGYNPLIKSIHSPLFLNILEEEKDVQLPRAVKFKIIKTHQDIESFLVETDQEQNNNESEEELSTTFSFREVLNREITIDGNNIYVISSIALTKTEFELSEDNLFEVEAFASVVLDYQDAVYFQPYYGPGFISKQSVGGNALYIYKYDTTTISELQKSVLEQALSIKFGDIFDYEIDGQITVEQENLIKTTSKEVKVFSSLNSYSPGNINNPQDLEEEFNKLKIEINNRDKNFLTPQTTTIDSYNTVITNPALQQNFEKVKKCISDTKAWYQLRSKIADIAIFSEDMDQKSKAKEALQFIDNQIKNSSNCNNSTTPQESDYADILGV